MMARVSDARAAAAPQIPAGAWDPTGPKRFAAAAVPAGIFSEERPLKPLRRLASAAGAAAVKQILRGTGDQTDPGLFVAAAVGGGTNCNRKGWRRGSQMPSWFTPNIIAAAGLCCARTYQASGKARKNLVTSCA